MNTISKEAKINFLKGLISAQLGLAADCDEQAYQDFWKHIEQEYLLTLSILFDYSPEEAAKYDEDFMTAVNKWIDELNESFKEV